MKSRATTAAERGTDYFGREREGPYFTNGTRAAAGFEDYEPAGQIQQPTYNNASPLPAYLALNTQNQDPPGPWVSLESSTARPATVHSSAIARDQTFGIYGTSSDYFAAEDLTYEPALPSPISSLGSHEIQTPFNSSTIIWERFPASGDAVAIDTNSQLHITAQGPCQNFDDEMDLLEEGDLPATSELDPSLTKNLLSTPLSSAGTTTEGSAASECITLEEPEISPAKRRRTSAPSPRWSTTRRTRKKKLAQTTIAFPQPEPSSSPKNHNAVEKQYRNRLNDKFEALLSVLPAKETEIEEEGRGLAKVSKGEVLTLAKGYIEHLERSTDELQKDRISLEEDIKAMKEVWIQSGGVVLP